MMLAVKTIGYKWEKSKAEAKSNIAFKISNTCILHFCA